MLPSGAISATAVSPPAGPAASSVSGAQRGGNSVPGSTGSAPACSAGGGRSARFRLKAGSAVPAALGKPLEDGGGDVPVFRDQMAGTLEAVHFRVRQPADEVLEVPVGKDRIPRTPEHQGRNFSPRTPFGDAAERREAGMGRVGGNVSDKVPHAGAAAGAPVRGHEGAADILGQRRVGQGMRHPQEGVRRRRSPAVHGRVQGKPQRRRDVRAGGLVDGGVGQHDPGELLRMCHGPAEADHATPVVADGDDRPVQPERGGEVAQVVDPVRQAPEGAGALGEAHIQLVHRHHAPRMGGVGTGANRVRHR